MEKKYYIGLDVHKVNTTYAVKSWTGELMTKGVVATNYSELIMRVLKYTPKCKFVLEASTHYYTLYQDLKRKGFDVVVANVIKLRRMIGKDDEVDAIRLADMLRMNSIPESYIPEPKVQNLRSMVHLYHRLIQTRTRYKNQIHAGVDQRGIRINVRTPFTAKWKKELKKSLRSFSSIELRCILGLEEDIEKRISKLIEKMLKYTNKHFENELEIVTSIPGIGNILGMYILAETLPINRFANKKKLVRYAGVIPVTNKSDGKTYSTFLPKCASRKLLRYALVEGANCAIKFPNNFREYFNKKRKGKKYTQAIMCVSRSIGETVYSVLSANKPYQG